MGLQGMASCWSTTVADAYLFSPAVPGLGPILCGICDAAF